MNDIPFRAIMDVLGRFEVEAAGGAPVCLAICGPTGAPAAFLRMDGAPERTIPIARGKAYTAARLGTTTQAFHDRLVREGLSVSDFCDPGFTALAGGVPVPGADGRCLGGVGVSGRKPEEDAELAARLAAMLTPGRVR